MCMSGRLNLLTVEGKIDSQMRFEAETEPHWVLHWIFHWLTFYACVSSLWNGTL